MNVTTTEPGESVRVQIFTVAYRKVSETVYSDLPVGTSALKVSLRDRKGALLSNGCYYLVVMRGDDRSIGKLVILR